MLVKLHSCTHIVLESLKSHMVQSHPWNSSTRYAPKTSHMYQVCFSKSWWLLRVSHPKIRQYSTLWIWNFPFGFEKPWWFCASSDASPRNEVNLLFFDPLAKEERTLPHHVTREVGPWKTMWTQGMLEFYRFLARGDVFKPVLLRKVFQFAKHSVSIGDQKETKLQRATIGLRKFDATFLKMYQTL